MTDVTDNFNRANGALGTNWSAGPSFSAPTVVSNACAGGGGSVWQVAYWNPATNTFSNDQYSQCVVGAGPYVGLFVRHQAAVSSGYMLLAQVGVATLTIYRIAVGAFTQISTSTFSAAAIGDTIRLAIAGSALSASLNGVVDSHLNVTDTTYTTGQPGISVFDVGVADNWLGGPVTVVGPPPPIGGTKTVRVIANANLKNMPTVNVVTSRVNEPVWSQSATGGPANQTVQVGGNVSGLKRVYISGYTGPI